MYELNIKKNKNTLKTAYTIAFQGPSSAQMSMDRNGFILNGERIIPVMGEVHYSRIPRRFWRKTLLTMKAAGITQIASYVIWNHHEEEKGIFRWNDRRDLRTFIELCRELNLSMFLRMGPWSHAEARYGGFPDWLVKECGSSLRTDSEPYVSYVQGFISAQLDQIQGLGWSDGGPIVGVQVENEFPIGSEEDLNYVLRIKKQLIDSGLHVPIYGMTAWPQSELFPAAHFLPFKGDYPSAPWTRHTQPISRPWPYKFSSQFDTQGIGDDLLGNVEITGSSAAEMNPFVMAELGVSNQITDHRRPSISPADGYAMALVKAGSGIALPGYYMFTGGTNPPSVLTTLEENKKTGYPNDLPRLSYDFTAPIGEMGNINPVYYPLKNLHYVMSDYAEELSGGLLAVCGEESPLQYSFRGSEQGGFLFINNHHRYLPVTPHPDSSFKLQIGRVSIEIGPIDIPEGASYLLPVNMVIASDVKDQDMPQKLKWATAQPLGRSKVKNGFQNHFFSTIPGIEAKLCLDGDIKTTKLRGEWTFSENKGLHTFTLDNVDWGAPAVLELETGGITHRFIIIDSREASGFWKDNDRVILGPEHLMIDGDMITMFSENPKQKVKFWNHKQALFETQILRVDSRTPQITASPLESFDSGTDSDLKETNNLFLSRSPVEKSILSYNLRTPALIRAGEKTLTSLDAGRGVLDISVPDIHPAEEIELCLIPEDAGRICLETEDALGQRLKIIIGEKQLNLPVPAHRYRISLKRCIIGEDINDYRIYFRYLGDKAELRINGKLVADHFNQGHPWMVSLDRISNGNMIPEELEISLFPRSENDPIFLEGPMEKKDLYKCDLLDVKIQPLYRFCKEIR